jgi:hypothetical protein
MFQYAYQLLRQKLLAVPAVSGYQLKEAKMYAGQYLDDSGEAIYAVPAAFIEFLPVETRQYGEKIQGGVMQVRIHVITEWADDDDHTLTHMRLSAAVYKALNQYSGSLGELAAFSPLLGTSDDIHVFNNLTRIRIEPNTLEGRVVVTIQTFECMVMDLDAVVVWQEVEDVELDITVEVVDSLS